MESRTKWLENKHRKFSSKTVFLNNMTGDDQQLKCYILHRINLKASRPLVQGAGKYFILINCQKEIL